MKYIYGGDFRAYVGKLILAGVVDEVVTYLHGLGLPVDKRHMSWIRSGRGIIVALVPKASFSSFRGTLTSKLGDPTIKEAGYCKWELTDHRAVSIRQESGGVGVAVIDTKVKRPSQGLDQSEFRDNEERWD